jgi:hypothetical protein
MRVRLSIASACLGLARQRPELAAELRTRAQSNLTTILQIATERSDAPARSVAEQAQALLAGLTSEP